jgi:glycosyltransferase involved in cell wall biosynthesis
VEELTRELARIGVDQILVYAEGTGSSVPRVSVQRLQAPRLGGNIIRDTVFGLRLASKGTRCRPFIVHTHGDAPVAFGGWLAAKRVGAAHVHSFHAEMTRDVVRRAVLRAVLPKESWYLAVSRQVANDLLACGVDPLRVRVRPSGVRRTFFQTSSSPRRSLVVAGGRLVPMKRNLEFAHQWIASGIADVELQLFGAGPEAHKISRLCEGSLGVTWLGSLDERELAELLHEASTGLIMHQAPPRTHSGEGTPTLGLEMLASGCFPVVNPGTGEIPALIRRLGFGTTVDGLPPPTYVAQLAREYTRPEHGRVRARVREELWQMHSWPAVGRAVHAFYSEILDLSGRGRQG